MVNQSITGLSFIVVTFFSIEILCGGMEVHISLRQCDSLSPYLFIVMEEMVSRLLKNQFELEKIRIFFHPRGAP